MIVGIKKIDNKFYLDKGISFDEKYTKEHYNYKVVEVGDAFEDCTGSDFNEDYSFNIEKYNSRKENENRQRRIQELKNLLDKTDYIVTKLAEMQITSNENFSSELARYQSTIQNRVAWRSELDRLLNE